MPLKSFSEFIWKHVFNNFTAKVMALAMALGLWLYAYIFSTTPYEIVQIPVHVHAAEGWSVVNGEDLQVKADLSYPHRFEDQFIQDLKAGKTYIECNVAPTPDQKPVIVPLKKELLVTSRDFSLKIASFTPSELKIELIRETASMVRVLPNTSTPPPGYQVDAFLLPALVTIRGPEDVVAQLVKSGIKTEEMNISSPPPGDKDEWDMPPVPAVIPSSAPLAGKSYPITCSDHVQWDIHLKRVPEESTFKDVPIEILVPPGYPYVATPLRDLTTEVHVTGPKSVVDLLKKENIVLYVDVRDPKLVPQETPYTQPVHAEIVDQQQGANLVVKPAISTCAIKISEAKPK